MKITLAERYQSFRRQHEADYPSGKDLDKAFLVEVLTKGYGNPDKAARVLQKYSENRTIAHYGKKLVKDVERTALVQAAHQKQLNRCYPDNVENMFKL